MTLRTGRRCRRGRSLRSPVAYLCRERGALNELLGVRELDAVVGAPRGGSPIAGRVVASGVVPAAVITIYVLLLGLPVVRSDETWFLWVSRGDVLYRNAYYVSSPLAAWLGGACRIGRGDEPGCDTTVVGFDFRCVGGARLSGRRPRGSRLGAPARDRAVHPAPTVIWAARLNVNVASRGCGHRPEPMPAR
jgi:hypothetical protein